MGFRNFLPAPSCIATALLRYRVRRRVNCSDEVASAHLARFPRETGLALVPSRGAPAYEPAEDFRWVHRELTNQSADVQVRIEIVLVAQWRDVPVPTKKSQDLSEADIPPVEWILWSGSSCSQTFI